MKGEDVVFGVVIIALLAFVVVIFGLAFEQDSKQRSWYAVCEYEGGETQGNVCIKDDVVIITKDEALK